MKTEKTFVTKQDAADRIGVSRRSIHYWIQDGRLPVDELGRIPRAEFEEMMADLGAKP